MIGFEEYKIFELNELFSLTPSSSSYLSNTNVTLVGPFKQDVMEGKRGLESVKGLFVFKL